MVKFIKEATQEFEQNGRSEKFIKMENRIIKNGTSIQVYFFARYAKGADVAKCQAVLLQNGSLEKCYYFQKHVIGSDIVPFVKKAIEENDMPWLERFINLAKSQGKKNEISSLVKGYNFAKSSLFRQKTKDINTIIEYAQKEYKRNGRSADFIELEEYALYMPGTGHANVFAEYLQDCIDVKKFENVALLEGNPFNMYFIADTISRSDKKLMLQGLQLAKLDYVQIEKYRQLQIQRKTELEKALVNAKYIFEINQIKNELRTVLGKDEYTLQIENRYEPRVYRLAQEQVYKK